MNNEIGKEVINIKEEIAEMKEEISKLNNLIINIIEDFKIDLDKKIKEKDSKEIEDILKNCLDNF
jgi:hypothetical protein